MSSKHKSSRRSNNYPTKWSDWVWSEDHKCYTRHREVAECQWEWKYRSTTGMGQEAYSQPVETEHQYTGRYHIEDELPADLSQNYQHDNGLSDITQGLVGATIGSAYGEGQQYTEGGQYQQYAEYNQTDFGNSKSTETKCPECSMTFPRSTDLERHHKTVHLNNGVRPYECLVPGCPGNVRSWTTMRGYRQHEQKWHGPWSCSAPGCSRGYPFGFGSEADLEIHQVEHSGDLQPDKSRDERYGRKGKGTSHNGKGSPYKGADTSYDNQNYASEEYSEAEGKQQPLQDSSPPEGNVHPGPSYGPSYYPSTNSVYQQQPLYPVPSTVTLMATPSMTRKIRTKNPKRAYDHLDKRFKVHRSTEFQFGRVFKVLWSEPKGAGGTEITMISAYEEKAFHKVRRFVIASAKNKGHSICLPILTYGMQGVLKSGVHPEDHAVVYSSGKLGPYLLDGEKGLMTKSPIRIDIYDPAERLDPLSRLNYAKLYTVEHNVKVFFIGRVARNNERAFMVAYNEAHPPFDPGPGNVSYEPDDDDGFEPFSMAEKDGPQYPLGAMTTSTATSYGSSQSYPYAGSSYVSMDALAATASPSSSQTSQAAAYPAYDDGYDY